MFFDKTAEKGMDKDMSTKKTNNEKAAEKEMDNNLKVFYVGITPKHKGYHYITALLTEKAIENPYINVISVKEGNEGTDLAKALAAAATSRLRSPSRIS